MNTSIRKMDELNRVVIPIEVRIQFGLRDNDTLYLTIVDHMISVTPKVPCCPICKAVLDNELYGICNHCAGDEFSTV